MLSLIRQVPNLGRVVGTVPGNTIEHTLPGTARGKTGGNTWTFDWVAPSTNVGDVGFYGAGNASNGNNANTGDKIYTKSPAPLVVAKGQLSFTEVAAEVGIASEAGGMGVAWGDYNGDGAPDLYIARGGQDLLYRNNGDGTLTEVGPMVGIRETAAGQSAVWGDYDGDKDLDLFVANAEGGDVLYRNNGDGTFTDVGSMAGVAGAANASSRAAAWADVNGDAQLDLLVVTDGRDVLYQNQGDGTFAAVEEQAGINGDGVGHAVVIGDYNGDGKPDVFVAGEGMAFLYRNNGDGSFTEVAGAAGINLGETTGRAAAWVDDNGDGKLDVVVIGEGASFLYRNNGDGTFTNVASDARLSGAAGRAVAVADYDGDGDPDLFVANGGQDLLYRNNGNGTFNQVAEFSGMTDMASGQAAAWGDYNQDGRPDLFVANAEGRDFLYRNPGT
ncbi:MAG: VCBS repeat-containing protein [Acidobacteria bacterium]|nr:VCBS repeat-containing protein [Acidobacteriota bacterium]